MWPKRADEVLNGGSLYWVFKGLVLCRQRILRLDEVEGGDGIRRCGIVLDPEAVRVAATQRRPFQGWRYLQPSDAPRDLTQGRRAKKTPYRSRCSRRWPRSGCSSQTPSVSRKAASAAAPASSISARRLRHSVASDRRISASGSTLR
jgi:hypothetical protein